MNVPAGSVSYLYLYLCSSAGFFRLKAFVPVVAVVAVHVFFFFFTGVGCCTTPQILRTCEVSIIILSNLDLTELRVGADTTVSGREFHAGSLSELSWPELMY